MRQEDGGGAESVCETGGYGGGLRPLAPGGEQQVREDEDYKNTIAGSWPCGGVREGWIFLGWL